MKLLIFNLWLVGALAMAEDGGAFLAGVARADITPTVSMPMYGYENRKCGPSSGVHDPLYAKVLVLESSGVRLAIVTLDLGSITSENLQRDVADNLGITTLLLAASHSHSTPVLTPAYRVDLEKKIFSAVEQAAKTMFPAKLSAGRGAIQLGYNRLRVQPDGRARVMYRNPERIPWGPVDPEIGLLRVEDAGGKPRALLVHYAAHAVVLGQTNCKFSADYPGVMQADVEAAIPEAQVMFVQGGAGDINPILLGRSEDDAADFAVNKAMGSLLAAEVIQANSEVTPVASGAIRASSQVMEFGNRWENGKKMLVGITTVAIGKDIALATIPGEPMHLLQKKWKMQAPVKYPFFYGYTFSGGGQWAGYIPDLASAARGGYGADASTSIEVGAGERLVEQHLINLFGLQGMWRDHPGQP